MFDPMLPGLLNAYAEGDRTARLALLDWLEERGDPRLETVRQRQVDWDAVARRICHERSGARTYIYGHDNYVRWLIDCALVGDQVPADIARAVENALRDWLARLFPECK